MIAPENNAQDNTKNDSTSASGRFTEAACVFVATGAWVGRLAPFGPGTFGALWGLSLAWGVSQLPHLALQVLAIAAVCAVGVPICTIAARRLGEKDPGAIVWDEIASVPITFFLVPAAAMNRPWVLLVGFVLGRLFDVFKPPPIRHLEHLPDGLGVMADDWGAGVYSCLALHLLLWLGWVG